MIVNENRTTGQSSKKYPWSAQPQMKHLYHTHTHTQNQGHSGKEAGRIRRARGLERLQQEPEKGHLERLGLMHL